MISFQSNILFIMSLSGTVLFALYIVTSLYTQAHFTAKWRYNLLKVCLLFYVFPFPEFRYYMQDVLQTLHIPIPYHWWSNQNTVGNMKFIRNTIHVGSDKWILSDVVKYAWGIVIFSGVTAVIIIIVQAARYFIARRKLTKSTVCKEKKEAITIFKKIKKELNIKENVQLIYTENCDSPFTTGVFSPMIVLPYNTDYTIEQLDFILRHELTHIKNKDFIVKFIAIAVVALHWFNPICILLYFEIRNMSEIHCDSETVKNYDDDMTEKYCFYMVDLSAYDYVKSKKLFYTGLISEHSSMMKRRVLNLKKGNRKKGVLPIITAFVICCLSMSTVFAYEAPITMELQEWEEVGNTGVVELLSLEEPIIANLWNDKIVTDNEGNTYEIGNEERALCKHNYVSCTFKDHKLHSDSSCTTYLYEADKCTKCGNLINKELTNELSYKKCPH